MTSLLAFSLLYCILKQIDCVLPCVCSGIDQCGKNKKVAHEPLGECATDVLTRFFFFFFLV